MIEVIVPATSANLGCGFDSLGIALKQYMKVRFIPQKEGIEIHGCPEEYCNEDNLIFQAFKRVFEEAKQSVTGIRIEVESEIPVRRGLGSSGACIVAGALGANALLNNVFHKYKLFHLCVEMEGHADNIAPALFGNLCVSFFDEQHQPNMITYSVDSHYMFVLCIPPYSVSTKEARAVLPEHLSYFDAVHQIGHACAFAKAMEMGNSMIVKKAVQDRMHEPYRKAFIKDYDKVKQISEESQAVACVISGSGSTMLSICDTIESAYQIKNMMKEALPEFEVRIVSPAYEGAKVMVK